MSLAVFHVFSGLVMLWIAWRGSRVIWRVDGALAIAVGVLLASQGLIKLLDAAIAFAEASS